MDEKKYFRVVFVGNISVSVKAENVIDAANIAVERFTGPKTQYSHIVKVEVTEPLKLFTS